MGTLSDHSLGVVYLKTVGVENTSSTGLKESWMAWAASKRQYFFRKKKVKIRIEIIKTTYWERRARRRLWYSNSGGSLGETKVFIWLAGADDRGPGGRTGSFRGPWRCPLKTPEIKLVQTV